MSVLPHSVVAKFAPTEFDLCEKNEEVIISTHESSSKEKRKQALVPKEARKIQHDFTAEAFLS